MIRDEKKEINYNEIIEQKAKDDNVSIKQKETELIENSAKTMIYYCYKPYIILNTTEFLDSNYNIFKFEL